MNNRLSYNPDVLSCLANLSNDEVFTPPQLANQMLDMLPQELFQSPDTKFLDPCTKSGVFLREIAKRLIEGLADTIPDLQQRIDHIMHHQLYGVAITQLTSMMSRRSLYCSKSASGKYSISQFDDEDGNIRYRDIRHTWVQGKCQYCGASQLSDGGQAASAKPLYHYFVEQALKLKPRYLTMIIPARWYAGGKGLDAFRNTMLNSNQIKVLVDFNNSADCFPGVNIAGGVCYFLWDKDYKGKCEIRNYAKNGYFNCDIRSLKEFPVLVRNNLAVHIIRKMLALGKTLDKLVCSYSYFAVRSYERGTNTRQSNNDVVLLSSQGKGFYPLSGISDRNKILNKYKVIITYAMSGGNKPTQNGDYQVISSLQILLPNEVCTETYLVLGIFDDKSKAMNMCKYITTKIFRFLLLQALTSIHITKDSFQFVPLQDFSKPWTDEELYKKYGLTDEEIQFIESMIRPME